MTDRYWFDNTLADEGARLRLLERIADPRSIRLFEELGVRPGDACVELGAGGGSMALWLADRVGNGGSVLAVDRDLSQCRHLSERSNVQLLEADLGELDLKAESYDLVHTRNVLMHVAEADRVIAHMVGALRPSGCLLIEEADYYSLAGITSPVFRRVVAPLVSRWTWARTIPGVLSRLPVADIRATIDAPMLQGASEEAAFWMHTINSSRERIVRSEPIDGESRVTEDDIDQCFALLGDPTFWTPFASVVCVSARPAEQ